jgi:hypothetical protein
MDASGSGSYVVAINITAPPVTMFTTAGIAAYWLRPRTARIRLTPAVYEPQ